MSVVSIMSTLMLTTALSHNNNRFKYCRKCHKRVYQAELDHRGYCRECRTKELKR